MSKFKVGDVVKDNRLIRDGGGWNRSVPFTITAMRYDGTHFQGNSRFPNFWYPVTDFGLFTSPLSPEEEAIELLKSKGYTVEAPKPKRTGWVNMWVNLSGNLIVGDVHPTRELADARFVNHSQVRLACVQITEGDGLECGSPSSSK